MKNCIVVGTTNYAGKMFKDRWHAIQSLLSMVAAKLAYSIPSNLDIHAYLKSIPNNGYEFNNIREKPHRSLIKESNHCWPWIPSTTTHPTSHKIRGDLTITLYIHSADSSKWIHIDQHLIEIITLATPVHPSPQTYTYPITKGPGYNIPNTFQPTTPPPNTNGPKDTLDLPPFSWTLR